MSEIEQFWKAIAAKSGVTIQWSQLHPQMQMQVIESVNLLMHVLGQCQQAQGDKWNYKNIKTVVSN